MSVENESNMELLNTESLTHVEEEVNDVENITLAVDYHALTATQLIQALDDLSSEEQIIAHKNDIESIRKAYYDNFHDVISNLDSENQDDVILKDKLYAEKSNFDKKITHAKEVLKNHFKKIDAELKKNVSERLEIIEELKSLIKPESNISNKFNAFSVLRDRWKNAGPIPKDKYNHIWNNYRFHVENFFDYIHLDKEARDLEFKHNYDKKVELLDRIEMLLKEDDIKKALGEIRMIQKTWREDIGPVERTKRDELWARFDATNEQVINKKKDLKSLLQEEDKKNAVVKAELVESIKSLTTEIKNSIEFWNKKTELLTNLKEQFIATGRAPKEINDKLWSDFRGAVKYFNEQKNNYFKKLREEQNVNIEKKKALIAKAKEVQNTENWNEGVETLKQVQNDWKKIGHVPAKFSNSLWKEFKEACDHFFTRLHEQRNAENEHETLAYNKKVELLKVIENTKLNGDPKSDIAAIQELSKQWNEIGRVPFAKKSIQDEYNKVIDALYSKIKMDKTELELLQFKSAIERFVSNNDIKKLNEEEIYISKKITEIKAEINQLENNILFISNAKKDNPFLLSVQNNIQKHKELLDKWKVKLKIVRSSRSQ